MTDPNRPLNDPEAANQAAPVQQPPDAAEAPLANAAQSTENLPAAADSTENFVAENPLAAGDVSLAESLSLAENGVPPEVFSQNVQDAFDGSQSAALADDVIETFVVQDLQPGLPDSTDNATDVAVDADPSSFPDDFTSGEMSSHSDLGPSADAFAASPSNAPPRFTGPLVEKSPGVFVSGLGMTPPLDDPAAQPSPGSPGCNSRWVCPRRND